MFAKKGFIHEKHKQIQPFNRFFRPKFTLFRSFVPFTQIQMYETRKLLHRKTCFGRKPVKHGQTANLAHQCPTRTTVSGRTCRNLLFFHQHVLLTVSICLTFLPFFILVKLHGRLFHRKKWLETQICVQKKSYRLFPATTAASMTERPTSIRHILIPLTSTCSDTTPCFRP